ncbi:MAG: HAD family phosphatase [Clostridia bacterium]
MNFKYAIFDLDGTLLDSTHVWIKVDKVFLAKRGFEVPSDYAEKIAHASQQEAATYTKNRFKLNEKTNDIIKEWNDMIFWEYAENISLKPFAKEYLEILKNKGVKLAVATGLPHSLLLPAITRLGIAEYFSAVCSVDDVGKGKGEPDLYIHTSKILGADTSECIVFEDVLSAIKVAKSIGMAVCGVCDKQSKNQEEIRQISDYYIKSWKEMT